MPDKDFTTKTLEQVIGINLSGVFPNKHGLVVEKMLDIIDAAYSRHEDPVKVHELQVHQLYSFLRRAYLLGQKDGMTNASERIKSTIFGVDP